MPLLLVVFLCCGLPLLWIVWQIVANPHVWAEAWPDAFRLKLLGRTLLYNGSTALIATAMGVPVGIVLGRGRGVVAKVMWVLLPVSLLLPSLAYAYGWSQFFRLLQHPLGELLHKFLSPEAPILEHLGITLSSVSIANDQPGERWFASFVPAGPADAARCSWSLATWLWPVSAAMVGIALRRLDTQLQLQALLDGRLWRITLRELSGVVASATMVCAILAVQEFSVYEPTGISVIATEVRMVFETGAFSSPDNPITAPLQGGAEVIGHPQQSERAAASVATTLPLLVVVAALAIPVLWAGSRWSASEEIDPGRWPGVLDAAVIAKSLAALVVIVAVIVPTASLVWSLKVYRSPLEVWTQFAPQVGGTILIGMLAGMVALAMGAWAAVSPPRGVTLIVALVTFLIGGQLIAIALIRLYNRPEFGRVSDVIYNAPPVVVMAYLSRFGWVALVAGRSTWTPRWRALRDVAAVDGAGAIETAAAVVWPLAWPILAAAGVLVMALSLTEVPATLLLSPQRPPVLTPMLMTWVHMLRFDPMIEASLLMMFMVAVLGLVVAGLVVLQRKMKNEKRKTGSGLLPFFVFPFSFFVLFLAGCGDSNKPDAIWCDTGTGPAQVVYPRAIAYKKQDDTFFVIDRMARVQHLSAAGECLGEWRMPQWQNGKPVGVSVGPDGNVYVPDTHYQRVMVYAPDGKLLRKWGEAGRGLGQFIYPTDIAFDAKGNVFVSEYGDNDRVQVFSPDGKFLYTFGTFGNEDGQFMRPQSLLIDGDDVYVTDSCNHRIAVFKTDGTFVRNMGRAGSSPGEFRYPYGLDEDDEGHLIVCEFGNNRVQMIDKKTGAGLKIWGAGGHEPGQLAYPWGVAVDKKDRVIAVDAGNNRLQVFGF